MRKVTVTEELMQTSSDPQKIDMNESDKIIAVLLKNTGTAILKSGMNSSAGINKTLPGASMPYGGLDGYIMTGSLVIEFDAAGGECVAVIYKDAGESTEC